MSLRNIFRSRDEATVAREAEATGVGVSLQEQPAPVSISSATLQTSARADDPLCFPESVIPPEAPTEETWRRFEEQIDGGLLWNPDRSPESRLIDEEAVKLEIRGVTPQTGVKPHWRKAFPTQTEFWRSQTALKNSVAAKLREAGMIEQAEGLENCHSEYTVAVCSDCGVVRKFPNRCDRHYCPECQPGLANDRRKQVEWWTATIRQPKHVVLTVRNLPEITAGHVREFREMFTRLRRRKFARHWTGGFYSLEVTNEGSGWHLHLHALIDAKWIDAAELALQWHSCTRGAGRIVKVKDCRGGSYLQEICKYAVKGTELARWSPVDIASYLRAFEAARTFGVFGSLYGARTEFAEFIATLKASKPKCECGSCNVRYLTELDFLLSDLQPDSPGPARAIPPPATPNFEAFNQPQWPD